MGLLIVLGLFAFGLRVNAGEVKPTCTPRNTTLPFEDNTLTFSFFSDIERTEILVLQSNENSTRPAKVVDCYPDNGSHTCEIYKTYIKFTLNYGKKESKGILQISDPSQQCAGEYACQTQDGLGNQKCDPCVVHFAARSQLDDQNGAGNNNKRSQYLNQLVDQYGAGNNNKNMAPEKPETDQTSPLSPGLIVGSIVGAVCSLGFLVAGGFIIKRKRNGRNTSQKNPIYNPISTNPAVTV